MLAGLSGQLVVFGGVGVLAGLSGQNKLETWKANMGGLCEAPVNIMTNISDISK